MIKIIADNNIPFLKGALEPYAEVVYLQGKNINRDVLLGADAMLIRTRTKCTEDQLQGTGITFIGTATIGYDHIDTGYCEKNNIRWTNAPGCNSSSVQQYIAAALLNIASDFGFSLSDKTLGIIGVGNVGSKVEKVAKAFGMNVLLNDPPRARKEGESKFVNIDRLLHDSDIVTLHVPLSMSGVDKTFHLLDDSVFRQMKRGSWIINSSRGEVVETESVKYFLESGFLSGAVLDVWENEPEIDPLVLSKAYIATPHIAGYSTDGKANGTAMVVNSLCNYFNLPLKTWYPGNVPGPTVPEITIDGTGRTEEDVLREAVLHTYNIKSDDSKLRLHPDNFEKQRGDYPIRREFPSYTLKLLNCSENLRNNLLDIGFKVIV